VDTGKKGKLKKRFLKGYRVSFNAMYEILNIVGMAQHHSDSTATAQHSDNRHSLQPYRNLTITDVVQYLPHYCAKRTDIVHKQKRILKA